MGPTLYYLLAWQDISTGWQIHSVWHDPDLRDDAARRLRRQGEFALLSCCDAVGGLSVRDLLAAGQLTPVDRS